MKNLLLKLSLVVFLASALPAPVTSGSPLGAPAGVEEVGTVDYINLKDGKIVVGDVSYLVTTATPVVLTNGRTASIESLEKGTRIGFTTTPTVAGSLTTILRIWVLPKDYVLPKED